MAEIRLTARRRCARRGCASPGAPGLSRQQRQKRQQGQRTLALHAFHSLLGQAVGAAALGGLLALSGSYAAVLLATTIGLVVFGVASAALLPLRPVRPVRREG